MVNAKSCGVNLEVIKKNFDRAAIKRAVRQFERIDKGSANFDDRFAAQCFLDGERIGNTTAIERLRRSRSQREKKYRDVKRKSPQSDRRLLMS